MPLYPPSPITPWAMISDDNCTALSTTFALSANNTYIMATTWNAYGILTGFRVRFVAGGNGNYDVGLYDSAGNRLCSIGTTATATGILSPSLSTAFKLYPGRFYLAFWIDNATDTVRAASVSNGLSLCSNGSTGAGGLPSSVSPPLGNLGFNAGIIGLISGGWS